MTTAYYHTCDCVVTYSDDGRATLRSYVLKCAFHERMSDEEAFAEILSANEAKEKVLHATRLALYGDARNPEKYGFGPEPVVKFVEDEKVRRNVVVEESSIPPEKKQAVETELAKISSDHEVKVADTSKVSLMESLSKAVKSMGIGW